MDDAPKLDPRTLDEIVSDTEALAMAYSRWRPSPTKALDFGGALVRLFGSMVEHLVGQLNRVPHKHQVAFTGLLGAKRIAPRAARVPLQFALAPGEGTVEVPQGAEVAATTPDGTITFETELALPLTRAQLVAVFVRDVAGKAPNGDPLPLAEAHRYADRTTNARGTNDGAFEAFGAPVPAIPTDDLDSHAVEHELFVDVRDLVDLPTVASIDIVATPVDPGLAWSPWDPAKKDWSATPGPSVTPKAVVATEVDGQPGNWLRAKVSKLAETVSIGLEARCHIAGSQQRIPELGYFNAEKLDLSRDFRPFGDRPHASDACYFGCADAFGLAGDKDGVTVTLDVTIANPPASSNGASLIWERWTDTGWQDLKPSIDPKNAFVGTTAKVVFTLAAPIDLSFVNGVESRWIRVRLDQGSYNTNGTSDTPPVFSPPTLASVRVSWSGIAVAPLAVLRRTAATYDQPRDAKKLLHPYLEGPERVYGDPLDTISTLHLGFDQPFESQRTTLYFEVVPPPSPEPINFAKPPVPVQQLQLVWETRKDKEWVQIAVEDGTRNFSRSGLIRFEPRSDMAPLDQFGRRGLYWLRVRPADAHFTPMPQLRHVAVNTVWASHQHTTRLESLGGSNGTRGQTLRFSQAPVLEGQQIEVAEPQPPAAGELSQLQSDEGEDVVSAELLDGRTQYWVRWHEVADFWASGPRDRHYTFDSATGTATFGDGVNGMIPPTGTRNVRAALYRSGGGPTGNVAAGLITQLKTTVPDVDSVTNFEPAVAGAPIEPEAAFMDRASRTVRHAHRAVTAQDYADLALEASKAVARAVALTPAFSPVDQSGGALTGPTDLFRDGQVIVVIVPALAMPNRSPSLDLLAEVQDYVGARCPPAARLEVIGPSWVAARIDVGVAAISFEETDAVRARVSDAIYALLHPVTGGDGNGWELGRRPRSSDLLACIMSVPGVDHVSHLKIVCAPPFDKDDKNVEISIDELSLYERLLVYAKEVVVSAAHPKVSP